MHLDELRQIQRHDFVLLAKFRQEFFLWKNEVEIDGSVSLP